MADRQVGMRIRELRKIQSYTREVLAEKIGISPKFLYEIEMGKKGFSAETLCRMSRVFCISCDYIMFGEENKYLKKERIVKGVEMLQPAQICQIKYILKLLYEIYS